MPPDAWNMLFLCQSWCCLRPTVINWCHSLTSSEIGRWRTGGEIKNVIYFSFFPLFPTSEWISLIGLNGAHLCLVTAKQDAWEAAGSLESSHPAMPAQKTCRQEGGEVAKDTLRQKSTARDRMLTFRRPWTNKLPLCLAEGKKIRTSSLNQKVENQLTNTQEAKSSETFSASVACS